MDYSDMNNMLDNCTASLRGSNHLLEELNSFLDDDTRVSPNNSIERSETWEKTSLPVRIVFGNKARIGKDTSCDYLIEKLKMISDRPSVRLAFADPIYDIMYYAQNVCGMKNCKDRKFLQLVGTEWGRDSDPDIWVNIMMNRVSQLGDSNIFISDHRFENELKLRELGFIFVKINRNSNVSIGGISGHASETQNISDECYDFIIDNNGTLEQLYEQLDKIVPF